MLIPDPTNSETTQLSIQRILGCSSGIYIFEDAPKWILMQVVPSLCEECWVRTCKAIRNQCHLNKISFKKYKGRKRKHIITEMLKDKLVSFYLSVFPVFHFIVFWRDFRCYFLSCFIDLETKVHKSLSA